MKKVHEAQEALERTETSHFKITSKGLDRGQRLGTRTLSPVSGRYAILQELARDPNRSWTAEEMQEELGVRLFDYLNTLEVLRILKAFEHEGLVIGR